MSPVSSRTHRMSKPSCTISGLSGLAAVRLGKTRAGRRLQKRLKCRRSGSSEARSGWRSGGSDSHRGRPTEPNRIASLRSQTARVAAGSASPYRSMAPPPTAASVNSNVEAEAPPDGLQHLEGLPHDLRPDPVTGQDGNRSSCP